MTKTKQFLMKAISLSLSLLILIAACPIMGGILASAEVDTSSLTAYSTSNAKTKETLTAENLNTNWTVTSDNMLRRGDKFSSNWENTYSNLNVLYVNTKKYKSFEMTVDFKYYSGITGDNATNLVGFGATEMGKSYYFDDNTYTVNICKYGGIMTRDNSWLTGGGNTAADKVSGYTIAGKHTLVLKVLGNSVSYSIDGHVAYSTTLSNYTEAGYIYLATNKQTTEFGIPTITELEEPIIVDTSKLAFYYAANAANDIDFGAANEETHWKASNGMLVRQGGVESEWSNATKHLSVIYVKNQKYKNFEMTVDYQGYDGCQNNENMVNIIGFGATEMGKNFYYDSNAFTVKINKHGGIGNKSSDWIEGAGMKSGSDLISGWSQGGKHTLTLRVLDNVATYIIDGVEVYARGLNNYDEAGYIYLASNQVSAKFGVPTVTALEATEPDASLASSPLYKKSALFIGDSISFGAKDDIYNYSWGGRIGQKYGMDWKNCSISGSAITTQSTYPIIKNQLPEGKTFDYVVIEGGINDAMNAMPLGEITASFNSEDFDNATFAGGFEELLSIVRERYPQAKVSFIVTFRVTAAASVNAETYYNVAKQICDKWNVGYIDLYNNAISDTLCANPDGNLVTAYLPDTLHPNAAGYELIAPIIAEYMETVKALVAFDANGDGAVTSDDLVALRQSILSIKAQTYSCDMNGDKVIDVKDLVRLKKNYTA